MVITAIIPMMLIGCFSYIFTSNEVKNEFKNSSAIMLKQISQNIDQYLNQTELITKMALRDIQVKEALKWNENEARIDRVIKNNEIEHFMSNISTIVEGISGIYIFTDYRIFSKYLDFNSVDYKYDFKNDYWYKKTVKNNGVKVLFGTHTPFQRKNSNEKVISFARTINDFYTNKLLGVILIDLNLDKISKICNSINSNKKEYIIIDNGGKVIFTSGKFPLSEKLNVDDKILNRILNNYEGNLITNINDEKTYLTYLTSGYSEWKIIMYVPYNELINSSIIIARFIIVIAFLAIISVFITAANTAKKWAEPIVELSKAIEKVGKGDFEFEIKTKRKDEIGKLIVGFEKMVKGLKILIRRTYQLKVKQKQAELGSLQRQINPHFLYNTLQSIQMKAVINEQYEIADMIETLGDLFKLNIGKGDNIVTIGHEIRHVELYIKIQKLRYGKKLEYIENISKETELLYTIRFILQPIIENAVSYGIERKLVDGYIKLSSQITGSFLLITIEDNGVGIEQEKLKQINQSLKSSTYDENIEHIGIKNVNDRIKLYFGNNYGISVDSKVNEGTKVYIKLPIIKDKNDVKMEKF